MRSRSTGGPLADQPIYAPELKRAEFKNAEQRSAVRPHVVHEAVPTLAGNIIGGVSQVAALNHAQMIAGQEIDV